MVKWSEDKKKYYKEYYQKNKKTIKGNIKKYQNSDKGKKKIKEYIKEYNQRPEVKKYKREYRKEWISDESNKLKHHFLFCFRRVLKRYHKTGELKFKEESRFAYLSLGIDFEKVIKKLEPLPKNLENYHVDHIIPLVKFDFTKKEDIKKAWNPKNIRLITKEENLKKNRFLINHNFI